MKRLFTFIAVLFVCGQAIAQEHMNSSSSSSNNASSNPDMEFGAGSNVISLGIGFGGAYSYALSGSSASPNFILSYDRGIVKAGPGTISIGGLVSYNSISYEYTSPYLGGYYYDQKWTNILIGLRGAYHYNFTSNPHCDFYAGLIIGYDILNYSFSSNDPYVNNPSSPFYYTYYNVSYPSYLSLSAFIGFRYMVTQNIGFYAEAGYGYTILSVGASLKF